METVGVKERMYMIVVVHLYTFVFTFVYVWTVSRNKSIAHYIKEHPAQC